jgi:hypothetical protein
MSHMFELCKSQRRHSLDLCLSLCSPTPENTSKLLKIFHRTNPSSSPSLSSFNFPSAFSGRYLTANEPATAIATNTTQTRYPFKNCVLAPVAKRLVKMAGPTVRIPEVKVRARPLRVPREEGEGEISFSASWTPARGC